MNNILEYNYISLLVHMQTLVIDFWCGIFVCDLADTRSSNCLSSCSIEEYIYRPYSGELKLSNEKHGYDPKRPNENWSSLNTSNELDQIATCKSTKNDMNFRHVLFIMIQLH